MRALMVRWAVPADPGSPAEGVLAGLGDRLLRWPCRASEQRVTMHDAGNKTPFFDLLDTC